MSYIGNTPISVAFLTDTFSGDGSTTAFTMTVAPANTSSILVAVTGVVQDPSTYSVAGTTLTFSAAPPSGTSNISVRYLGIPASGVTTTAYRTVTNFTATAGQTSFSVPSYTIGYIDVYRNGVRLVSTDYTATTGTTVVLNNACTVGDAVVTESFYVSSVLNAIPATAGSVLDSYIVGMSASKLTGTQTIPKATLPTGSVLQVLTTTTTTLVTNSTATFTSTGLSLNITPSSATSKILVLSWCPIRYGTNNGGGNAGIRINRASGTIVMNNNLINNVNGIVDISYPVTLSFLDSPATTSSTNYTIEFALVNSSGVYTNPTVNWNSGVTQTSTLILMEIAA
jgi:hypothetical protein